MQRFKRRLERSPRGIADEIDCPRSERGLSHVSERRGESIDRREAVDTFGCVGDAGVAEGFHLPVACRRGYYALDMCIIPTFPVQGIGVCWAVMICLRVFVT